MIDKTNLAGISTKDIDLYKVSEWSEEQQSEDDESIVLYNCEERGKDVFDEYYEELYFIYKVNKKFGADHYSISEVEYTCTVVSKTFYRTKELVKETTD